MSKFELNIGKIYSFVNETCNFVNNSNFFSSKSVLHIIDKEF